MEWVLVGELETQAVGLNHYDPDKPRSAGARLALRRNPANPYDPK